MEIKLKDFIKKGEIVSFVNFSGDFSKLKNTAKISYITNEPFKMNVTVKRYFERRLPEVSEDKLKNAFKIANLSLDVLTYHVANLSTTECRLVHFIEALLLNSEVLVFQNFTSGFYRKSCDYYQKLFLKLTRYGKSILFFTNDIEFLFGISKEFFLFDAMGHYQLITDWFDDTIYKIVDMPPIIHYIKYLHSRNIKMEFYIEPKELLKAIYRDVTSRSVL